MKIKKLGALLVSAALCAGMAAPAFAFEGEVAPVEQPVLPEVLNGSLYPHLMEVEQTSENRMQQTMAQLLKQNPAPDKEQNQMAWVQHMNSLRAQAEELVLNELIYS